MKRNRAGVNMYSGTMIEDLIKTVQQAEKTARRHVSRPVTMTLQPAPRVDLQAFFYQMQTMKHVQVGMA